MSCPDLVDIVRTGTKRVDPAVLAHLRTCRSCRLDWQILQGAQVLSDPEGNAQAPGEDPLSLSRLNRQAMTRIRLMARLSGEPASWRQLCLTGLLIAFGVLSFLVLNGNMVSGIPFGGRAIYAIAAGIAGILYLRVRDARRRRSFIADPDPSRADPASGAEIRGRW